MQQNEPREDNVEGDRVVQRTLRAYLLIKLSYFHVSKPQCPRLDVGKASYSKGRREESPIRSLVCYAVESLMGKVC